MTYIFCLVILVKWSLITKISDKGYLEIGQRDIQVCHWIKNNTTIIKLGNRKDCLLRAEKRLKDLDGTTLNLPRNSKISLTKVFVAIIGGCETIVIVQRVITKSISFTPKIEWSVWNWLKMVQWKLLPVLMISIIYFPILILIVYNFLV